MNTERRFHIEQDRRYEAEQCGVTKKWSNTKVKMISTYTVYEFVGSPSYQTPIIKLPFFKDRSLNARNGLQRKNYLNKPLDLF
jgi:hypothetical protein